MNLKNAVTRCLIVFSMAVVGSGAAQIQLTFEEGRENHGRPLSHFYQGITFTGDTSGNEWTFGDFHDGEYHVSSWDSGEQVDTGQFWIIDYGFAVPGDAGDSSRIVFDNADATYLELRYTSFGEMTIKAYNSDGILLDTASGDGNMRYFHNNEDGPGTLRVEAPEGETIAYITVEEHGSNWVIDNISTDDSGVFIAAPTKRIVRRPTTPRRLRPLVNYTRTNNSRRLAHALDNAANPSELFRALDVITNGDLMAETLESMVPYESVLPTQMIFDSEQRAHETFAVLPTTAPLGDIDVEERFWVSPYGAYVDEDSRSDRPSFTYWDAGVLLGYDMFFEETSGRAGLAGGVEYSEFDAKQVLGGDGKVQTVRIGPYYRAFIGQLDVDASLLGGFHMVDVDRRTVLGENEGDFKSYSVSAQTGAGWPIAITELFMVRPQASMLYTYLRNSSYTESGNPATALRIDSQNKHSLKGDVGVSANHDIDMAGRLARVGAMAGYTYEFLYDSHDFDGSFVHTRNSQFSLSTSTASQGAGYVGLYFNVPLANNMFLDLEARTRFSGSTEQISGQAVITWLW